MLDDGRVLVAGGNQTSRATRMASLATAELFDPKAGRWAPAGSMKRARLGCTAVALPGGRMLVIGGFQSGGGGYVGELELFDKRAWSTVGQLATPRSGATATVLGSRALVMGGETNRGNTTDELITLP